MAIVGVRAAWPAPANAVDLFPVDDWLGEGIKQAGEVALGPIKFSAEAIAKLIATIVGALADLLVPKSLVSAGVDGIRWLVSLPAVGAAAVPADGGGYALSVRMPHVVELRQTLTWIGVTLLPVGLVLAGGRAILAPSVSGEGPGEILVRVCTAGLALISYDLIWAQLTRLSRLITDALLRLPWVDDGIERMLETLLIGGAAGTAVAAEFVIPLLIMVAGGALLALLLLRVGLEVATALLYVLGGLVLGLSPMEFGRRLMIGWLFAATAIVVLPVLWTIVFVTGAALMLDAGTGPRGGLGSFVAQLFNIAAAAAVFGIAIKLGLGVFHKAQSSIASLGATQLGSRTGSAMPQAATAGSGAAPAGVPASLAGFSRNLRAGAGGAARTASGASVFPVRHPFAAASGASRAVRHPVQATQHAADQLRDTVRDASPAATTAAENSPSPAAAKSTAATGPATGSPTRNGNAPSAQPDPRRPRTGSPVSRRGRRSARHAPVAPASTAAQPGPGGDSTDPRRATRKPRSRISGGPARPVTTTAVSAARRAAGMPTPEHRHPATSRSTDGPRPATAPPNRTRTTATSRRKPRPLTPNPQRGTER